MASPDAPATITISPATGEVIVVNGQTRISMTRSGLLVRATGSVVEFDADGVIFNGKRLGSG